VELQLKSIGGDDATGEAIAYDLEVPTYNQLREATYQIPRILVVVVVPTDRGDWVAHTERELALRRCGYWLSLIGAPPTTNQEKIRVRLPRTNVFDVAGVQAIMGRIRDGGNPWGAAPFRRRASHRTEMAFGPRRESLV
jgi:hypothetical protein